MLGGGADDDVTSRDDDVTQVSSEKMADPVGGERKKTSWKKKILI